jgi:hypothetical protein
MAVNNAVMSWISGWRERSTYPGLGRGRGQAGHSGSGLGAGKQAPKSVQGRREGWQRLRETTMVYEGKVTNRSIVAQRGEKD